MLTINFIGGGRVGKTLARLLKKTAHIAGVMNSTVAHAEAAVQWIGQGTPCHSLNELPAADITFITTPDFLIGPISEQLAKLALLKKNAIVVHCSGALSAASLSHVQAEDCRIAALHPIKSFADVALAAETFAGTYCSVEGDVDAVDILKELFTEIGAIVFDIQGAQKNLYHAACVMAHNYSISLHAQAARCFEQSGMSAAMAQKITSMLMLTAIQNVQQSDYREALTGPLQRGDIATVKNHLTALQQDPVAHGLYSSLGAATLPLTSHGPQVLAKLKKILFP